MQFDFIVAVDAAGGLSKQGNLPWKGTPEGREDMNWFRTQTSEPSTAVIMGRRTWDSLPRKPLLGRVNIVLTRDASRISNQIVWAESLAVALEACVSVNIKYVMVIGGLEIYRQALQSPYLRYGWVTRFNKSFDCDCFFPELPRSKEVKAGVEALTFEKLDFTNKEEDDYLDLLHKLLSAPTKPNRTGIPTRSLFHEVLKFKLFDPLRGRIMPLLTTKRVPWKAVAHECLWFLRGACTNTDYLKENGVHIWDGNSTRAFLDSRGLTEYREGELGKIYGSQWRHWNAPYPSEDPKGIDQLAEVIHTLKTDPWSRRMIVSAWNPEQIPTMALPACHYCFQFVVDPDEQGAPTYLNCLVNMRSADVALGVPFNIASYALITHIVANITGLTPGVLSISMADCHIYETHIEGIKTQLKRTPLRFPTIRMTDRENIDDHVFEDFVIDDYHPARFIKLEMAV